MINSEDTLRLNLTNKLNADPFYRLVASERLTKDVESLMNSSFWIEALKSRTAQGISDQLNCNKYFFLIFLLIISEKSIFLKRSTDRVRAICKRFCEILFQFQTNTI